MSTWQRILLAVIVLEIPFQIDTYVAYQEKWAAFGAIGGFNLSLTTVCLGILYAFWGVRTAALAAYSPPRPAYLNVALTTYVVFVGVSLIAAQDRLHALYGAFLVAQAYLIYVYAGAAGRGSHTDPRRGA
jgi:hypothetical protein